MSVPRALDPFLAFPAALRQAGFPAAPEQTEASSPRPACSAPRRWPISAWPPARSTAPAPSARRTFDAVFDTVFLGRAFAAPAPGAPEALPEARDAGAFDLMPEEGEEEPSGAEATAAERLTARALDGAGEDAALRRFARSRTWRAAAAALAADAARQGAPCRSRPGLSPDAAP